MAKHEQGIMAHKEWPSRKSRKTKIINIKNKVRISKAEVKIV